MKIAHVVHVDVSVPPEKYGGTERVVSYLTEELVRLGHDVTLFASGDSITSAKLVPICDRALSRTPSVNRHAILTWMLERACHQLVEDEASAETIALAISEILWRTLAYRTL